MKKKKKSKDAALQEAIILNHFNEVLEMVNNGSTIIWAIKKIGFESATFYKQLSIIQKRELKLSKMAQGLRQSICCDTKNYILPNNTEEYLCEKLPSPFR